MKQTALVIGGEENPSLPIIESLTKKGIKVTVGSHKRISVGFFSRYPTKRVLYPSPHLEPDAFLDSIWKLVRTREFDVTLVTGEQPTYFLSKHKDMFIPYTRLPLVDFATYMKCRDKSMTMKIASTIGIPIPKTYYPEEDSIEHVAEKIDYPTVLKPISSNGARGIMYPKSSNELIASYWKVRSQYGPCIIQEYIPHTGMQYKAELLLDSNMEVKAWCVYDKRRYYPPMGGSSTLNCTVDRRDILGIGARILQAIGWYGMGDCDFIEDPRDGVPKLMEINPRFTRSIKICVLAGVDFPYLLYRMALGEEIPTIKDHKIGAYLRYLPSDILWFLRSSERFKARPSFFWFFGKNLRDEIISFNDPGPAIAFALSTIGALFNSRERAFRLR